MNINEVIKDMEDAISRTSCVYPKETPQMLEAIKKMKADLLEMCKEVVLLCSSSVDYCYSCKVEKEFDMRHQSYCKLIKAKSHIENYS
jgi:hypothetical protein